MKSRNSLIIKNVLSTLSYFFHPQRGDNLVQVRFFIDDNFLIYLTCRQDKTFL